MGIGDLSGSLAPPEMPASCEITSDGAVSALRVIGVVEAERNYAAPIRFYDTATATFPSLTAVGVETSAEVHVVVHNVTDAPVLFTPVLSEATLGVPRKTNLEPRVLLPHAHMLVPLRRGLAELAGLGISNATLTLQSDAPKGAFIGALTQETVDGLVEDVPLKTSNRARNAAGAYPLRWEGDYTNLITVTNTSQKTLVARSLITVGGVTYVPLERSIEPGRTAIYDVDKMRSSREKDVNGKVIPLNAVYGKFMWFDSSLGATSGLMGRNSVSSLVNHRKSSFSCGMDCGFVWWERPVFRYNVFSYAAQGTTFGSEITDVTTLPNGQPFIYPYAFSRTELSSTNSDVLSYGVDLNSTSSYVATAGLVGSGTASYLYHITTAGTDMFGDCTVDTQDYPQSGGAGTTPTITFTGQAQSLNGTTQNVVVGQRIALTGTLPSGATASWSVPGTTTGGFAPSQGSGLTTATDFSHSSTVFYWVDTDTSRTVTYTVTPSSGAPISATVTFNVVGPTITSFTSPVGSVNIQNNNKLAFGGSLSNIGIKFDVAGSPPTGYSGTFSWVQLITDSKTVSNRSTGSTRTCLYGPGLDSVYPYNSSSTTANDNPSVSLSSYVEVTDADHFTMYLMWTSSLSSSIPVPLGHVDWSWSGDAVLNTTTGVWSLNSSSVGTHTFVNSTSYLIWVTYVDSVGPPISGVTCY